MITRCRGCLATARWKRGPPCPNSASGAPPWHALSGEQTLQSLGEGLVILAAIFVGATLPILPVQILWISMTTAVLLSLVLVFEPKEADIMDQPPSRLRQSILTREVIQRLFLVGAIMLAGSFGIF